MPKLKVKYADGTIDEIKLYTEEPALAIFAILVGGVTYYAALGEANSPNATRVRVKSNEA